MAADNEQPASEIRRGKGLRLSVDGDAAEEHTATGDADATLETSQSAVPERKPRRGQRLRLSVQSDRAELEPVADPLLVPEEPAPPETPVARRGKTGRAVDPAARDAAIQRVLHDADARHTVAGDLRMIQLGRGRLAYRRVGKGPPLLLIHGWSGSSRHWLTTMVGLADIRTIYAIDLPGFGETPALAGTPSLAELADIVTAFVDAQGLDHFDIAGHSFGGAITAYLAAQRPAQVGRIVLTSFGIWRAGLVQPLLGLAAPPTRLGLNLWQPWLGTMQWWFNAARPFNTVLLQTPPMARMMTTMFLHRPPGDIELLREYLDDLMSMDLRAHLSCFLGLSEPALITALRSVRAETLVLSGREDRIATPDDVQAIDALIPHSRLLLLDDCGHVPMIEQPIAFHHELRSFFSEG
jgi:abhydrolase domain-containing protein 6